MDINDYQKGCLETWGGEYTIERSILGAVGEGGEIAEVRKKYLRGDYGEKTYIDRLTKELGDCLYYISVCAHEHGIPMSVVCQANYLKLKSRKERGEIQGDGDNR